MVSAEHQRQLNSLPVCCAGCDSRIKLSRSRARDIMNGEPPHGAKGSLASASRSAQKVKESCWIEADLANAGDLALREEGVVDEDHYHTTSILALLERRYDLLPLSNRDARGTAWRNAFDRESHN